jgi:hypothetical protein
MKKPKISKVYPVEANLADSEMRDSEIIEIEQYLQKIQLQTQVLKKLSEQLQQSSKPKE